MHAIHAILIGNVDCEMDIQELQEQAVDAIEAYADQAYDYCQPLKPADFAPSKAIPGPADLTPSEDLPAPVVRGTDPRFVSLVERWAKRPLEAAEQYVASLAQAGHRYEITPALVRRIWEDDPCAWWDLKRAIELATGVYTFDSGFFSAADDSPKLSAETRAALRERPQAYALVFLDLHI